MSGAVMSATRVKAGGVATITGARLSSGANPPKKTVLLRLKEGDKVKGIYLKPGTFEKSKSEAKAGKEGEAKQHGIKWTEDTVDNEFLNRKSYKGGCVYHKPRAFDESDSDESDYERPAPYNPNVNGSGADKQNAAPNGAAGAAR